MIVPGAVGRRAAYRDDTDGSRGILGQGPSHRTALNIGPPDDPPSLLLLRTPVPLSTYCLSIVVRSDSVLFLFLARVSSSSAYHPPTSPLSLSFPCRLCLPPPNAALSGRTLCPCLHSGFRVIAAIPSFSNCSLCLPLSMRRCESAATFVRQSRPTAFVPFPIRSALISHLPLAAGSLCRCLPSCFE